MPIQLSSLGGPVHMIGNFGYNLQHFGSGEPNVSVNLSPLEKAMTRIFFKAAIVNSHEMITLLMLNDTIKRHYPNLKRVLIINYMPGGRQDRICNPGEALSVKVYADMINSCNFDEVQVIDPHSDVTPALLDRCKVVGIQEMVEKSILHILEDHKTDSTICIVSPDVGASKKNHDLVKKILTAHLEPQLIGMNIHHLQAHKHRDVQTGNIVSTKLLDQPVTGHKFLVVDDICDGGRTFIELAKVMVKAGVPKEDLYLYVTHGLFTRGVENLKKGYNKIFTHSTPMNPELQGVVIV